MNTGRVRGGGGVGGCYINKIGKERTRVVAPPLWWGRKRVGKPDTRPSSADPLLGSSGLGALTPGRLRPVLLIKEGLAGGNLGGRRAEGERERTGGRWWKRRRSRRCQGGRGVAWRGGRGGRRERTGSRRRSRWGRSRFAIVPVPCVAFGTHTHMNRRPCPVG